MKDENVKIGRSMLEAEAKHRGYNLSDILTEESFAKVSEKFSFFSQDEMFASVGYGAITVNQVLFKLIDFYKKEIPKKPVYHGDAADSSGVIVKGMSGLLTRFAGCCNPVPGDNIVGFVSRGRGCGHPPRRLPEHQKPRGGAGPHPARRVGGDAGGRGTSSRASSSRRRTRASPSPCSPAWSAICA